MDKPEIVFFGSGPVATKSLELLSQHTNVVAVITKPKPAHHRGQFPVIELASRLGLALHTVTNKRELSELMATRPFMTEVAVLIDFGIIVTQDVIDYFPRGIVNSHFSLLPQLRGADPISFAILEGLDKTGVSLMLLVEAMDEGPVIACGVHELDGTETTPDLTEELILLSDALLKSELPRYLDGGKGQDQMELASIISGHPAQPSYSRKLTKDDGILDFNKPAAQLEREIRAFMEWPKSRTKLAGIDVIITSADVLPSTDKKPGEIDIDTTENTIVIHCSDGALNIEKLKPAGKNEMAAKQFLLGYKSRLK